MVSFGAQFTNNEIKGNQIANMTQFKKLKKINDFSALYQPGKVLGKG